MAITDELGAVRPVPIRERIIEGAADQVGQSIRDISPSDRPVADAPQVADPVTGIADVIQAQIRAAQQSVVSGVQQPMHRADP